MDIIKKLKNLEIESHERGIPILGSLKGKWLLRKIRELKPEKILELGTANGYSGIILGSEKGKLTTVEINPSLAKEAKKNFEEFKIKAEVIIGDGVELVKKISLNKKGYFDLIFIDFAKKSYVKVLEDCIRLVKKNRFIIADNMSFEECSGFKEAVLNHPELETEIIEVGDWMSFSRKIAPVRFKNKLIVTKNYH